MYKILNIILIATLLLSCNKATIDLAGFEQTQGSGGGDGNGGGGNNTVDLVGKWELTKLKIDRITNNPDVTMEMLEEDASVNAVLEILDDRNMIIRFGSFSVDEDGNWNGGISITMDAEYELSNDKKTLTIYYFGIFPEEYEVLSISGSSLTYRGNAVYEDEVTEEELEEYKLTSTYTKIK